MTWSNLSTMKYTVVPPESGTNENISFTTVMINLFPFNILYAYLFVYRETFIIIIIITIIIHFMHMNRSDNQDDAVVGGVNETTSTTRTRLIPTRI